MAALDAAAAVVAKVAMVKAATSITLRSKATARATTEHRPKPKKNQHFNHQKYLSNRLRPQIDRLGDVEAREQLVLNITCTVADIRPNGDLVLEGHRQIRINENAWDVSLSGICRHQDVGPDNVILSRNIADLKLDKREHGQSRDGYKRGWLTRVLDEFAPF